MEMLKDNEMFNLLTEKDRRYISQMMTDFETGGHVFRTDNCWKEIGIDREDYYKWRNDEWYNMTIHFGLTSDNSSIKEKQMWLYAKVCSDYYFAKLIGLVKDENDKTEELPSETNELTKIIESAIKQSKKLEEILLQYKDV